MSKPVYTRIFSRVLHALARILPGAQTLRPLLHRMRGVKIGKNVFIGDEVYLENEYPECVEIQNGVQISIRSTILAHTRGSGRVILEEYSYIGPHVVLVVSGGRELRIGKGAVISAGCVITKSVPAGAFVIAEPCKTVAMARVPLTQAGSLDEFVKGLVPTKSKSFKR